jgi:4-hydroxy-4-methyl-2-oxoglutarate aldolase
MPVTDENKPFNTTIDRPSAAVLQAYGALAPTDLCDIVELSCVMRHAIHPLWADMPRIAGPAFTVRTGHHDNLMLHAAIYLAQPGDVIVVEAGDDEMAVAGGNVCKIAQRRGIAGFIVDGVMRDVAEAREIRFPLFARGVSPIPAKRGGAGDINATIRCGRVIVHPGDMVVADEEGIVVVPRDRTDDVLAKAQARVAADAALSLDDWERRHRANVEAALRGKGYRL